MAPDTPICPADTPWLLIDRTSPVVYAASEAVTDPPLKLVASRSLTAAPETIATDEPFSVKVTLPALPLNTGASLTAVTVMLLPAPSTSVFAPPEPVLPPSFSVTVSARVRLAPKLVGLSEVLE